MRVELLLQSAAFDLQNSRPEGGFSTNVGVGLTIYSDQGIQLGGIGFAVPVVHANTASEAAESALQGIIDVGEQIKQEAQKRLALVRSENQGAPEGPSLQPPR